MNIYPVKRGYNRFCGPAVISAITQIDTDQASRLIRSITGKRQVTGTSTEAVLKAFELCGVQHCHILVRDKKKSIKEHKTLAAWLQDTTRLRSSGRVFLVVAGNHWQLISGRRYVCGLTGEIVSIRDPKVKRRARVTDVMELMAEKIEVPQERIEVKARA